MWGEHRIDKKWSNSTTTTTVAGTGVEGSSLDMLSYPWGIYVDINLDLYVADSVNCRIQLFQLKSTKWNNNCRKWIINSRNRTSLANRNYS